MIQRIVPTEDLIVDFMFEPQQLNYIYVLYYTDGAHIYNVDIVPNGCECNEYIHKKVTIPANELQQMHEGQLRSTVYYGYNNDLFPDGCYDRKKDYNFDIWLSTTTGEEPYDAFEAKVNEIIAPLVQRVDDIEIHEGYSKDEMDAILETKPNFSDIPDTSIFNPTSNFKTINGNSIIGHGNIYIEGGGSSYDDSELRGRIETLESDQISDDGRLRAIENNIDDMYLKEEVDVKLNDYNPTSNFKTINGESVIGQGNIEILSGEIGETINMVHERWKYAEPYLHMTRSDRWKEDVGVDYSEFQLADGNVRGYEIRVKADDPISVLNIETKNGNNEVNGVIYLNTKHLDIQQTDSCTINGEEIATQPYVDNKLSNTETWTFTLTDGTTVEKKIILSQ